MPNIFVKLLFIYLHVETVLKDHCVQLGAFNTVVMTTNWDLITRVLLSLPGCIYICIKIYRDLKKSRDKNEKPD